MRDGSQVIFHLRYANLVTNLFIGIQALHIKEVCFTEISKFIVGIPQVQSTISHFLHIPDFNKFIISLTVIDQASVSNPDLFIYSALQFEQGREHAIGIAFGENQFSLVRKVKCAVGKGIQ